MSSITSLAAGDLISNSRTDINTNFSNLNTDKMETSVLDTDNTLAANSDAKVASQKAVKTYIDTSGGSNASTTVRGIVEEATQAEVDARTATGGTGARLFVNPSTLPSVIPVVRTYLAAASPATWSKPTGLRYIVVEVQAAGGGGGGPTATNYGSGGGGGGYSKKTIAAATLGSTETVTIGAAGTAGSSSDGGDGGAASFGAHATANGGTKGIGGANSIQNGGAGGTAASGDVNIQGGTGIVSGNNEAGEQWGGSGGNSFLGFGGQSISSGAGLVGVGYGGGGSGGANNTTGGVGAPAIVIVTEYYST